MLGPCLSHIRVIFCYLLLLLLVWLRILLKWYKGPNMYHIYVLDHILAIIWSCLGYFCYIFVGLKEFGKCHRVQSNLNVWVQISIVDFLLTVIVRGVKSISHREGGIFPPPVKETQFFTFCTYIQLKGDNDFWTTIMQLNEFLKYIS